MVVENGVGRFSSGGNVAGSGGGCIGSQRVVVMVLVVW